MTSELPILTAAMPEIVLALGAMVLLMVGVFSDKKKAFDITNKLGMVLIVLVGIVLLTQVDASRQLTFGGMFVSDSFAIYAKVLVLIGSLAALFMASRYLQSENIARFEFVVLVALATLGMMLMISANNLLSLYIGLELQSLSLYVLAAINRDRARSTEAGLKYFVLGALSSGMLLYGVSLIYGFTGTTDFDLLASSYLAAGDNLGLIVGLVFVMAGLAFKVSAVPFHMWTPDVYEGAPTPVTAFFAAAPKVAALALFTRVVMGAFPTLSTEWSQIIVFMSMASMLVGAFFALRQTNIKRLMAYSSIGHVGFALMGLAAGTVGGIEALLVYLAIYLTMTVGSFGIILTMRRGEKMVEKVEDLAGLSQNNLPMAIAFAVFMFSLAGIPGLAGFIGKWYVVMAAVNAHLMPLAVVGVLASVVSAFYYLRVIKVMFFDDPATPFEPVESRSLKGVILVNALINSPLSYFFLIGPLVTAAAWAAGAFA